MAFSFTTNLVKEEQPELIQHLLKTVSTWMKQPTIIFHNGIDAVEVKTLEQFSQALVNEINQFVKEHRTAKHLIIGMQIERPAEDAASLVVFRYTKRQFLRQLLFAVNLKPDT